MRLRFIILTIFFNNVTMTSNFSIRLKTGKLTRREAIKIFALGILLARYGDLLKKFNLNLDQEELKPYWVMVIDIGKCIGCNLCTYACKAVNDTAPDIFWNVVYTYKKNGKSYYMPRLCMQCEEPPCVEVCPVGATYKREVDDLVVMDYSKCIGCRYCMAACPYGARYFNWKDYTEKNKYVPKYGSPEVSRRPRGVVEKCTFCYQRLDKAMKKGLVPGIDEEVTPACVVACPTGARRFGNLKLGKVFHPKFGELSKDEIDKRGFVLKEELGTKPRVIYLLPV